MELKYSVLREEKMRLSLVIFRDCCLIIKSKKREENGKIYLFVVDNHSERIFRGLDYLSSSLPTQFNEIVEYFLYFSNSMNFEQSVDCCGVTTGSAYL